MIDRILVADDEMLVRQVLEETALRRGVEVFAAASGEEAIEALRKKDFQMAFVDLKMGKAGGLDVLKFARSHCPELLLVIMTAYGTVETAVEAMKLGAFDFVIKPFSPDQMEIMIEKGRLWLELRARDSYLRQELSATKGYQQRMIGDSEVLRSVTRLVQRVASTDASVLITGESGTGKELIASEIHRLSDPEDKKPYIKMNCAAVPETLLESELFGHEKGAFTGAAERRVGRFELANGGTLLLDEIGEIAPAMQAKLLRVLQESEFERLGGEKTINVKVRVIATTNRKLKDEVGAGRFREDLFYRLNVFPIHLPPLRERGGDSSAIARFFLAQQSQKLGRPLSFSREALAAFESYNWPGNIRELENVVERLAILEDGPQIEVSSLPPEILNSENLSYSVAKTAPDCKASDLRGYDNTLNLQEIEKRTIERALSETRGNKTKAASLLGFSVRTLRNKLKEYGEGLKIDGLTED
ncbi:MAG: hypothetical protein A2X49_09680 [Lentisphaerae bacterium GWF2_52_8]|nr:MAG: hypothetical protein A2X49_09680 [Lentisphaerae bacterium GWF2_52_8]